MPHPPVTWLMVVRNNMPTLDAALASLAAQDYPRHELMVWDNGSTDGSADTVKRWLGNTLNGRVVGTTRLGKGEALACLVANAKTELLAMADPTTTSHPDRLSRQVAALLEQRKVGVLAAPITCTPSDDAYNTQRPDDAELRWALRFENPISAGTVMLRRSAVLEVGNVRDRRPGEDYDLWVRMAVICRFAQLDQPCTDAIAPATAATTDAIRDDTFRHLRDGLIDRLLPGTDPSAAVRLLNLVGDDTQRVTEEDLRRFRRSAMLAAQAYRYAPSYFLKTARFRAQEASLRERYLRHEPVIRVCEPLLRSAKTLAQKLRHRQTDRAA